MRAALFGAPGALCLLIALGAAGGLACGGASTHDNAGSAGGAGTWGGSARAADGGTAGGAGVVGSGGLTVIDGEAPVCVSADGQVGMRVNLFPYPPREVACEPLNQPGTVTTACPSDQYVVCDPIDCYSPETMAGCCRPDGMCGLFEPGFLSRERKLGCVNKDAWIQNPVFLSREVLPVACQP